MVYTVVLLEPSAILSVECVESLESWDLLVEYGTRPLEVLLLPTLPYYFVLFR
jgi:hypothetical protein